jgi:uncharacterized protein YukE
VSGVIMPGGDPGLLEQLAARLQAIAEANGDLGASTRQVTASIRSGAEWAGDAADAYTAFAGNLAQGVDAIQPPLSRIASAVRDYAGSLRAAQDRVASYASAAEAAQVSGNDSGYLRLADDAQQAAESAISAWQAVGDRAAADVTAAAGQLGGVFGSHGPVQSWLASHPANWDTLAGFPGLGEPVAPEILTTPPGDLGPEVLKTPPGDLGPEILITPPGDPGPEILLTPPGDPGPQILKTPPGQPGPLINYSGGASGSEKVSDVLKGKLGSIQRAPLPRGSPSWSEVGNMTMSEVRAAARANQPGFKAILKLLTDSRFNRK